MKIRSGWAKYQTYGPVEGRCNLCGKQARLTEDHIPPKGSPRVSAVALQSLLQRLTATEAGGKARRSQSGVKFRSLCAACNNGVIGRYDREYCDFTNEVASRLRSPLMLPPRLAIRARPQRLMRAVVGHLLAFGFNRPPEGDMNEALARFVLNESLPLPPQAGLYYWAFPAREQVVIRDVVYLELKQGLDQPFVFNLLKVFPTAFFLTWQQPEALGFLVESFEPYRSVGIDEEAELPLALTGLPPAMWPEAPTETSTVLYGGDPLHATPLGRAP